MISGEIVKPKYCKLLNRAITEEKSRFEELTNSTKCLRIGNLPHTNNKSKKCSTKNHKSLFDGHSKGLKFKTMSTSFIFLAKTLHTVDTKTKLKWTRQLILKLNLIHSTVRPQHRIIDLDCLKITAEKDLVIDLTSSKNKNSFKKHHYMPPNYYFSRKLNDEDRDIWTTGICIYYIYTLNFPWERASLNDRNFRIWIKKGKFKDTINEPLFTLLKDMLNVNQRVPINKIINKLFEIKANQKVMS